MWLTDICERFGKELVCMVACLGPHIDDPELCMLLTTADCSQEQKLGGINKIEAIIV